MASPALTPVPVLDAGQDSAGWIAYAQPEATVRLFRGLDPQLADELRSVLDDPAWARVEAVLSDPQFNRMPAQAAMPLGDAIALAKFLVDVTAGYSHFLLGPDTVGGPVEIASMSRHEGFKWVSRKHYYSQDLNPGGPDHAC